jgi:hypothetical protein
MEQNWVLDGNLPDPMVTVGITEVLEHYAAGNSQIPGYIAVAVSRATVRTTMKDGVAVKDPRPTRDWLDRVGYVFDPAYMQKFSVSLLIDRYKICRDLLLQTAKFLESDTQ